VSFLYLGLLLVSLAGLGLLDWHRRLAFFADARRTALLVAVTVAFFLVWDTVGIALGIFSRGDVDVMTGIELWPDMPLEEPFFLVLLTYVTLLLWRLMDTRGGEPRPLPSARGSRRASAGVAGVRGPGHRGAGA
jgi:lycopene cyclase domain-containing protein